MDFQILHNINKHLENLLNTPGDPGDMPSILMHISQTAMEFFGADTSFCFAFHPGTQHLMEEYSIVTSRQQENNSSPLAPDPRLKTLADHVLHHSVVVVEDVNEQKHTREPYASFMRERTIRSFAAIALRSRHRKRSLAVLYLNFRQKRLFNRRQRQNLHQFALLAGTLLQEAWLSRRYHALSHIGQEINHQLSDVNNLFEQLRSRIGNIVNSRDTLQLAIYHNQNDAWDIYCEINGKTSILNTTTPDEIIRYVTQSGQQLFVKHLSKERKYLPLQLKDHTYEAIVAVPLQLRDLTLGMLLLQHHQPDTYNKQDLFTLQLLANHIALALHNMRMHHNLLQLDQTGQIITQQLESDDILQATVDNVRIAAIADVVILFLVDRARGGFQLPPSVSGQLRDPDAFLRMALDGPDDIAQLMLQREEPLFVKQSSSITKELLKDPRTRTGNFEQREEIASTAAIPLRVNDETVGVLFVNFRRSQHFDSPQRRLIEGLGHYIAIALKNARTFEQLRQRRMRELDILQRVDRELNGMLDLESILDKILELATQEVDATSAAITLYDAKQHEFKVRSAIGNDAEQQRSYTIPLDVPSIMRWVMDHKQSARTNNVHTEAPWSDIYYSTKPDAQTVSELDVPLLDGDDFVGILNFEHSKEGAFSAHDQIFLETLAGQAVLAVKKAQTYEKEKRLVQQAQLLNEISREIASHLHFEHVFGVILEKALQLTRSTQGQFVLYDREIDELRIVDIRGKDENRKRGQIISFDKGIVGQVAKTGETLNIDPTEEPWRQIFIKWLPDTRSELAVPMMAGDELRGILNFESATPNHFSEQDVQLTESLADLAVVALQNAERYANAEREAERFELLYQVGQDLSNMSEASQEGEAYTIVHKIIEKRYPDSQVIIRCYEEESQQLTVVCRSPKEISLPVTQGRRATRPLENLFSPSADSERQEYIIHDITDPPYTSLRPITPDPGIHSVLIIPTRFKNRYYGRLELHHPEVKHFREHDVLFIKGLSHQLAGTLYRIQTSQERQEFETRATVAEAMSAIGQSAFELTHRLGNDLGLVPSYVEDIQHALEKQRIANPHIGKKLGDITQAVQTVLNLSKRLKANLVDMKGRDQLTGEVISISPANLFEDATSAVRERLKEIELCREIDSEAPQVKVIPGLVNDILRNLMTNAIEAMPNGGILTLRTRVVGRMVALEVSDTGAGIAPNTQKKIFDLFFSTKQSSGFGLWSAKRYALENHGDLDVESIPGSGSTFTLTLPRV